MTSRELKQALLETIEACQPMDLYEVRRVFAEAVRECELEQGLPEHRKGDSWTDDELRVVLSDAPTKQNCLKHARGFGRGYGSIEQIYRWAATPDAVIRQKRPHDSFVQQIKKVAKQLGWRA